MVYTLQSAPENDNPKFFARICCESAALFLRSFKGISILYGVQILEISLEVYACILDGTCSYGRLTTSSSPLQLLFLREAFLDELDGRDKERSPFIKGAQSRRNLSGGNCIRSLEGRGDVGVSVFLRLKCRHPLRGVQQAIDWIWPPRARSPCSLLLFSLSFCMRRSSQHCGHCHHSTTMGSTSSGSPLTLPSAMPLPIRYSINKFPATEPLLIPAFRQDCILFTGLFKCDK